MTTATEEAVIDTSAAEAAAALATAASDEDDYDALFNEVVAKREAQKNGEPAPVAAEAEPEAKPAAAPEGAAVADVKQDEATKVVEPDWVKDLPEARRPQALAAIAAAAEAETLRTENARVKHDNRSMVGRVAAYQRKYEEAAGKKPVDIAKVEKAEASATWQQFVEDYPDIAKAFEARLETVQPGGSADTAKMVEFMQNEMLSRQLNDAYEAVDAVHPGWRDEVKKQEFAEWKASSPTYERLASSDDIADAVALFDLWDAHRSKTAPIAPAHDGKAAAEAAKLAARRTAQAEGGKAAVTSAATINQSADISDPEQAFAFYAQQANARMKKRNQ